MVPSSNTTMESEFYKMLPEGFSTHTSRLRLSKATVKELTRMEEKIEEETGFSVERLRGDYLLVLLNPKEKIRVVKRLKMKFLDLSEIYERIAAIERNIKQIETEAEMSSRELRRVVKSVQ